MGTRLMTFGIPSVEDNYEMKNIKVGTRTYEVIKDDLQTDDGCRGSTYLNKGIIKLATDITPDVEEITLIHEILHCCADFAGMNREKLTEEEWVRRIAPILTQVLKENEKILRSN